MSKAQKGNKENKKPKADKTQTKKAKASRPAARSRKRPDARFSLKRSGR
jgi:hypothetical protein